MPRTRVVVGVAAGLLLGAGAIVGAMEERGYDIGDDMAAQEPQSPKRVASDGQGNFSSFDTASGSGALGGVNSAPLAATSGGAAEAAARAAAPAVAAGVQSGKIGPSGATAQVIKTASLQITVAEKAVASRADRVPGIAAGAGGYVAASERTGAGETLRAHYSLRVPADRFESTRDALTKLGKVSNETLGGRDVGGQLVDYEARLRSLRAEEEAFRAILSKAATVGETLQVTQALAEVRGRIEQLDAERAQLADAAALSTIDVVVSAPGGAIVEPNPQPLLARSVDRAIGVALSIVAGTVVVLGAAVPLAVLALVALGVYRLAARRRRALAAAIAS